MYIDAWTQKADVLSDLNSFANCLLSMALGLTMVTKTEEAANSLFKPCNFQGVILAHRDENCPSAIHCRKLRCHKTCTNYWKQMPRLPPLTRYFCTPIYPCMDAHFRLKISLSNL